MIEPQTAFPCRGFGPVTQVTRTSRGLHERTRSTSRWSVSSDAFSGHSSPTCSPTLPFILLLRTRTWEFRSLAPPENAHACFRRSAAPWCSPLQEAQAGLVQKHLQQYRRWRTEGRPPSGRPVRQRDRMRTGGRVGGSMSELVNGPDMYTYRGILTRACNLTIIIHCYIEYLECWPNLTCVH